jgi:hypothetical protein
MVFAIGHALFGFGRAEQPLYVTYVYLFLYVQQFQI